MQRMDELQRLADMVAAVHFAGLPVQVYQETYQLNVTDVDGVVQSYYASTGTAIFRDGNNRYTQKRKTVKDMPFDEFLALCTGEKDILGTYF